MPDTQCIYCGQPSLGIGLAATRQEITIHINICQSDLIRIMTLTAPWVDRSWGFQIEGLSEANVAKLWRYINAAARGLINNDMDAAMAVLAAEEALEGP